MKKFLKIIALSLACASALAFTSCGNDFKEVKAGSKESSFQSNTDKFFEGLKNVKYATEISEINAKGSTSLGAMELTASVDSNYAWENDVLTAMSSKTETSYSDGTLSVTTPEETYINEEGAFVKTQIPALGEQKLFVEKSDSDYAEYGNVTVESAFGSLTVIKNQTINDYPNCRIYTYSSSKESGFRLVCTTDKAEAFSSSVENFLALFEGIDVGMKMTTSMSFFYTSSGAIKSADINIVIDVTAAKSADSGAARESIGSYSYTQKITVTDETSVTYPEDLSSYKNN